MKKTFFAIALLSTSFTSSFAQEKTEELEQKPLNVTVEVNAETEALEIHYVQTEMSSSICGLSHSKLSLKSPKSRPLHPTPVGSVSFKTFVPRNAICLMAFGFNRGAAHIELDNARLQSGSYSLTIDGVSYGFIQFDGETAELVPSINVLF